MLDLLGTYALIVTAFVAGFILASVFEFNLKISKKEDYDERVKQLDELIKLHKEQKDDPVLYTKEDLFPPELPRDYGIPRDLKD